MQLSDLKRNDIFTIGNDNKIYVFIGKTQYGTFHYCHSIVQIMISNCDFEVNKKPVILF